MKKFLSMPCTIAATMILLSLLTGPAAAQASRTWVSGLGDDVNPCSRTAPCKTFAGAISKTAVNGEINCLDPGGFGALTITKSITIDCQGTFGSVLNAGTAGINVNFDSFAATDVRKTVNIRSLAVQGFDSGTIGIRILGVGLGSFVNIEDCVINGNFGSTSSGISDQRIRGQLIIHNTTVRNMGANGILVSSPSSGSLRAMISNTRVINSNNGIVAGTTANIVLSRSIISSNNASGLVASGTGVMNVDSTTIAHNATGLQSGGAMRISNSDISFNVSAVSGVVSSFTNNRFTNNNTLGTISTNGSTTNPTGQQ
jgi:hypothetical protein